MRHPSRVLALAAGVAVATWAGISLAGGGDHPHATPHATSSGPTQGETAGHSHEKCELHGGQVTMTKQHHFETLFAPDGIRLYVYSANQAPLMVEKAKGSVSLKSKAGATKEIPLVLMAPKEGEETVYFCPMHADVVQKEPGVCKQCGGMKLYAQDYLFAGADLSKAEPGTVKAVLHVTGLGGSEPEATFTETYEGPAHHEEGAEQESGQHSGGDAHSHH